MKTRLRIVIIALALAVTTPAAAPLNGCQTYADGTAKCGKVLTP
jgi:hypothetical protein